MVFRLEFSALPGAMITPQMNSFKNKSESQMRQENDGYREVNSPIGGSDACSLENTLSGLQGIQR